MNHNLTFRIFIAVSLFSFVVWILLPLIQMSWYAQPVLDITYYDGYGTLVELPSLIIWAIVLLKIVILIGLAFYIKYARLSFLIYTVTTLILVAFAGVRAQSSIESFMLDLSNLSDGIIVGLVYFSYYRDKFDV